MKATSTGTTLGPNNRSTRTPTTVHDRIRPATSWVVLTGATHDTNQGTYDNAYDGSNYDQSAPVYALEGAAQSPWSSTRTSRATTIAGTTPRRTMAAADDPHAGEGERLCGSLLWVSHGLCGRGRADVEGAGVLWSRAS